MKILSPVFEKGTLIPLEYTCKGKNVSPPLEFKNVPRNAESLVLLFEDIDATPKPWVHWLVFDILTTTTVVPVNTVPEGGMEGHANGGKPGYEGPCPKYFTGVHYYYFRLFALNRILNLPKTTNKEALLPLMQKHILETAELVGIAMGEK